MVKIKNMDKKAEPAAAKCKEWCNVVQTKSIEYSYMYCKMVDALQKYFDNKYDLSPLKANRSAAQIIMKRAYKHGVDKEAYNQYLRSLAPKVRRMARRKALQKLSREILHSVFRKLNKKYKMKSI